jgi:high-affinity iron transporter
MLGSAIIVFRETLEAALIIGIIAAATRMMPSRKAWIAGGIIAGILGALVVAALTARIAEMAAGVGQELFNAGVLGLAALMLAWHNIWMARHGMQLTREAKQLGQDVVAGKRAMSALGIVIALAVLREGSETALFLYGLMSGGAESPVTVAGGGAIGLALGIGAGYGLYAGFVRIPVRYFFSVTSGLILLLAAAMASQMARFLVQADLLPALADPLWDSSWLLNNGSLAGRVLHTLAGYEARPSGMQAAFYVAALVLIVTGMWWFRVQSPPSSATPLRR